MKLTQIPKSRLSLAGAALFVDLALAAAPRRAGADGPPPLPPEAYVACESKNAGDACVVQVRDIELHGTCASEPTTGKLFCRPQFPAKPPQEAIDACAGKQPSDTCTVRFGDHVVDGTCQQTPDVSLVCVPAGPPDHRGDRAGSARPRNDPFEYENQDHRRRHASLRNV
jgi:hypothetical protein